MNNIEVKEKGGRINVIVDICQGDSMTVAEFIEALNKCPNKESQVFLRTCLGTHNLYGLTAYKDTVVSLLWYQD